MKRFNVPSQKTFLTNIGKLLSEASICVLSGGDKLKELASNLLSISVPYLKSFASGGTIVPQLGKLSGEPISFLSQEIDHDMCFDSNIRKEICDNFDADIPDHTIRFDISCKCKEIHFCCVLTPIAFGFDRPIGYFWVIINKTNNISATKILDYLTNFLAVIIKSEKLDFAITKLSNPAYVGITTTTETAKDIAESCKDALSSSAIIIWKLDNKKEELNTIAYIDEAGKYLKVDMIVRVGKGIAGKCVLDGKPIIIDDLLDNDELKIKGIDALQHPTIVREKKWRSAIFIPLDIGDQIIGVLATYGNRIKGFSKLDETIARAFAQRLCAGYVHAQRIEQLTEMEKKLATEAPAIEAGMLAMEGVHDADDNLFQALIQLDFIIDRSRCRNEENNPVCIGAKKAKVNIVQAKRLFTELRNRAKLTKIIPSRINIRNLLDEAKKRYEFAATKIKAKISIHCPDDLIIIADKDKLLRVFMNLINNSIHFLETDRKGGQRYINISVLPEKENVSIIFEDNGPGIPKYDIPKIFDYLFTTKGPDKGMGFGLGISKKFITMHKGTIEANSDWGSKAEFVITLPLDCTKRV